MTTEYHGYTQPADGETDWGDILNNVLAEIDADVVEIGSTEPDTADNVPWIDTGASPPTLKVVSGGSYVTAQAEADLSAIDSDGDDVVDAADRAAKVGPDGSEKDIFNEGTVHDSARFGDKTPAEFLIDSPNGNIESALLENGESTSITARVADTETLTVYAWGAWKVGDGTTPSSLDVELVDQSGTVQASANTAWAENTAGVASYQNTSGSAKIYRLRISNGTGNNYTTDGVGGQFAFVVE